MLPTAKPDTCTILCKINAMVDVSLYTGRASATPSIDVFITLLSLGWKGYHKLCTERKENYRCLLEALSQVASKHGEQVLHTPHNDISIAVSLKSVPSDCDLAEFGSMLFLRCVSGTRVVAMGSEKKIGPHCFINWGSHSNDYHCAYFTAAAAVSWLYSFSRFLTNVSCRFNWVSKCFTQL